MGLIPEDKIAEVRDRTDIVQVVGEYVTLKRSGVNYKGLCPFHQEKSPSFNVNSQKQMYYCFGCQKSGDVIRFVMELDGKTFMEVIREMAQRAGVELPEAERSREAIERQRKMESEREKLVRVNEIAAAFYRAQLDEAAGQKARAYVESRGLSDKMQEAFSVGYAPAGWEALTKHLEAKKVPHELCEKVGLIRRRDRDGRAVSLAPGAPPSKATHFDVFVDRVMYALTSHVGTVLGFGGRVLEDQEGQPKYKNSPETPIYKKGENLFGLHLAKHAIRKGGRALLVEGNFDVMTLHDRGIEYVVAPQGTAITAQQVELLGRFAKEVVIMLDADPAGRAATMKVIRLFVESDVQARVAQLRPVDGKKVDPDDLAKNDLPRLLQMIEQAQDAVEFFFDQVISTSAPTVPGKAQAIEECVPLIAAVKDSLVRSLYVAKLAQLLRVDENLVKRALHSHRPEPRRFEAPNGTGNGHAHDNTNTNENENANDIPVVPRPLSRRHGKLLAFLTHHAVFLGQIGDDLLALITDEAVRTLLAAAKARGSFDASAVLESAAPEIRDAVARAVMSDEYIADPDVPAKRVFDEIVGALRLPNDKTALVAERQAALDRGDLARAQFLTAKILSFKQGVP